MSEPGTTFACVTSHDVPAWSSNPVPLSSFGPATQVKFLPPALCGVHTSRKALLTEIGFFIESNTMFLFVWFTSIGAGSISTVKKSLNVLQM